MTLGQSRVRTSFNPAKDNTVDHLKHMSADLIDECVLQKTKCKGDVEQERLWALAMTYYENAAMWAVKAATMNK